MDSSTSNIDVVKSESVVSNNQSNQSDTATNLDTNKLIKNSSNLHLNGETNLTKGKISKLQCNQFMTNKFFYLLCN